MKTKYSHVNIRTNAALIGSFSLHIEMTAYYKLSLPDFFVGHLFS